jgi:hypothetical protein
MPEKTIQQVCIIAFPVPYNPSVSIHALTSLNHFHTNQHLVQYFHPHTMCAETVYSSTDPTCACRWSSIVTCAKAKLPPPEKRKTQFPTCVDYVTRYDVLTGKCKDGGESEKE